MVKDRKGARNAPKPPAPSPPPAGQPEPRRCRHVKPNGKPCRAHPLKDSEYCPAHDPRKESKERFKAIASAGGKAATARPAEWTPIEVRTKEDLRRFINEVLNRTAGGTMSPKLSYALAPQLTLLVRLFEEPALEPGGEPREDLLPLVLEILDAHPEAKAEMIKRIEMMST